MLVEATASNISFSFYHILGNLSRSYEITDPPPSVEFAFFSMILNGNKVGLRWRTETEANNHGFDIERTTDNSNWKAIGFVEGHGNTNSPKFYSFIDDKPSGVSSIAYRLKQVDNDGQYECSSIVEVNFAPTEFALYQNFPNPFNPTTKIKYSIVQESIVTI